MDYTPILLHEGVHSRKMRDLNSLFMNIIVFVRPIQNTRIFQIEPVTRLRPLLFAGKKIRTDIFPFFTGSTGSTGQIEK